MLQNAAHAPVQQMICIRMDSGWMSEKMEDAIRKIYDHCDICWNSGIPNPSVNEPISHLYQSFNEEIKPDFTYVIFHEPNYTLIHHVDSSTGYYEGLTVTDRKGKH